MSDSKKRGPVVDGSQLRSRIQRSIEHAEEERKREMLKRRLELARTGVRYFQVGKIPEAVRAFHSYLKILEDWKNVPEGHLNPVLFDRKLDMAELLLISGVYWDLLKLYDRTSTAEKKKEFLHYLEKYIIFSKGMPFQPLCAETLRKYIANEKPKHVPEFKVAYRTLTGSKCFVATSLIDLCDSETLPRLRAFRDEVLKKNPAGRRFVAFYYRKGPSLANWLDHRGNWIRFLTARSLDRVARILKRA